MDTTKFHIEIIDSNDGWDMNFISAVLQECGIHFNLENPPEINSVDDLIKLICLSSSNIGEFQLRSSNIYSEPYCSPIYKLYELNQTLFGLENLDYQDFLHINYVKELFIEYHKMFHHLLNYGDADIEYIHYPIFEFIAKYNPILKMKLKISSDIQDDLIVVFNNGKIETGASELIIFGKRLVDEIRKASYKRSNEDLEHNFK